MCCFVLLVMFTKLYEVSVRTQFVVVNYCVAATIDAIDFVLKIIVCIQISCI
jgi:hypothetical protein